MSGEETSLSPRVTEIAPSPPTPVANSRSPQALLILLYTAYILLPLSSAVSALLILIASGWLFAWRKKRQLPKVPVGSRLWLLLLATVTGSALFSVNKPESWIGLVLTGAYLAVIWVT